ncbi:hypothetical protein RJ55_06656 [Drechmeria coniospora]|nr:hypothetical protein RJ55_06656 [Drechmeria coniospora]
MFNSRGLSRIERAFIVEEADRFSGVLVEFKHDLGRLQLPAGEQGGFNIWDTPCPPPPERCFDEISRRILPRRLGTLQVHDCTGFPMFMSLQIGFEAAEDILIGSREKSFSIIQEPAMLVFDKPDSLPISFVGAYSDNEDFVLQNVYVAFDSLPSTMMKPAFPSASLEGATKSVAVLHTGNGDLPGTDHTLQEWTAERPRTMQTGN